MRSPFLRDHKSEAKLCRKFPKVENPSRRAPSPSLLRRLSLSSLSPARRSLSLSSPSPSLSLPSHALSLSPSRRRREVVVLTRSQPSQSSFPDPDPDLRLRLIVHGIARMIDEWIMMHKNPHIDKWDLMN
ncbi:hypothetical protein IGI04_016628 [Brassica rapa subsp. trilocularis]|uniref:Uncharacterized protein n=1 Tax=Brassica rapa subsp. trilocularis TaxID=1813537 RepID=A0ABQ7MW38_BRACM|nr:hypothetical protein IGI04_016628 [Brassica rapa subsp. trilocularis]